MATATDKAGEFGYSLAFFNSNPELRSLLDQATSANWTSDRFVAALRNTQWFQHNGESQRKYQALIAGDPATLNSMLDSQTSHILQMGAGMGAMLSDSDARGLADVAVRFNWNDDQLKRALGDRLSQINGLYQGQAGANQQAFKQLISQYGVDVSDNTLGLWVRSSMYGDVTPETVKNQLIQWASSKYPPYAQRLAAGETMQQIADPYVQSQAKLLEMNPESINFASDPLIQQALVTKDDKGQPVGKTVWQFENDVRNDARWAKTQNAQDSMSQTASKVLQQFGLTS